MPMKKVYAGLLLLSILLGSQAFGGTLSPDLQLGVESVELFGALHRGANVDAVLYYVPTPELNPDLSKCDFGDDLYNFNGRSRSASIKAVISDGSYKIDLPITASRGACRYELQDIYFKVEGGKVYELLHFVSIQELKSRMKLVPEIEMPDVLPSRAKMYCEFSGSDSSGLCEINSLLPPIKYAMDMKAGKFEFNVLNRDSNPLP